MKVLVTGANGFIGSALCRAAHAANFDVIALVRAGADTSLVPHGVRIAHGEFHNLESIGPILRTERPTAIIHAAAILSSGRPDRALSSRINVEGTRAFADEAADAGVKRWVQISSMSAHAATKSIYGSTKFQADEIIRAQPFEWVILRPSIVYGPTRRGIFHKMCLLLRKLPIVPLVGNGLEQMRPVHVDDLAAAAIAALQRPEAARKTYMLGCAEMMNTREFLSETARQVRVDASANASGRASGRAVTLVPLPLWLCKLIAVVGQAVSTSPPITTDNVEGVAAAQPLDIAPAQRELNFAPRVYREGLAQCIGEGLLS